MQLGKCNISCTLPLKGDQLLDYGQYKYSSEFGEILRPHIGLLHKLTFLPGKVAIGDCPALAYLKMPRALWKPTGSCSDQEWSSHVYWEPKPR
jgi:hypothetical protein